MAATVYNAGDEPEAMRNLVRAAVLGMRQRIYKNTSPLSDKERMKRLLKDFREKASTLPDFYKDIDKKHGGNVDAYVDYLFANSMMTDETKWKEFIEKPTPQKLKKDPAYLYTLSVLRYKGPIYIQTLKEEQR